MITPRITRLVRVPDLRAMHASVAALVFPVADPHGTAVVVPTRGAAEELRRTLEKRLLTASVAPALPDIITRDELYARLYERLPRAPGLLTEFDREVMLRRAAGDAVARGAAPPFRLRPGLLVEILGLYDELRRNNRTLDDFDRLMVGTLEPVADTDRGAERMLRQTHFLSASLAAFEQYVSASGRVDEHGLRTLLLTHATVPACRHIVVTVADQAADARGLWPCDFDLLTRLPLLERLDVIATEALLASGFHERIRTALPGLDEERSGEASAPPTLAVPERPAGEPQAHWFTSRDREEELVAIARTTRTTRTTRTLGIVFQRPLPYLYLARQVFTDAKVPYQALDSLPLAGEPFVAALDVLLTFVIGEATRASTIALLRSPHWRLEADGAGIDSDSIAAADDLLLDLKYAGGFDRLSALAAGPSRDRSDGERRRRSSLWRRAAPALKGADAAARSLRAIVDARSASSQIETLLTFIRNHERLPSPPDEWYARHLRAREAVLGALERLRDAHARHEDEPLPLPELAAAIRRWIEGQTFSPATGDGSVRLLDAAAAPYADLDELCLVGLVESDWPERSRRNIFYPVSLLGQLGWPAENDRLPAARARFQDLLLLPRTRVAVSTFTLEDDAIVPASALLEDVQAAGLPVAIVAPPPEARVFTHEALAEEPVIADAVEGSAAEWLAMRLSRSRAPDAVGVSAGTVYAVSHVERYLECPFKYYAAHILRLPEERDDESGLTPQERGQFLHEVFRLFFEQWHAAGRRAITSDTLEEALALFERVTEEQLLTLAEADRALERTCLLGSAAAAGLAARAFAFEIEQGTEVVERLLEYELEGEFEFRRGGTSRMVALRGKADRIDLLADGTLRVIDYKLGRAPKMSRALQLPIYGICAQQRLRGRHGRNWAVSSAGYVAFKEKDAFVPFGGRTPIAEAIAAGEARFLEALDGIEAGHFPADPDEPYRCNWCPYPSVCRKDYVGDE